MSGATAWVAEPEHSDDLVREKTGHTWDEWVAIIDAGPGRASGHSAIAAWLIERGVAGWWAQSVTVGYERITGLRMPGQMPDGTFTVSRSRTVSLDPDDLRARLADEQGRAALVPDLHLTPASRPGVKSPRFTVERDGAACGRVQFSPDATDDGRCRLTVAHEQLPSVADGEHWKAYWSDWLAALND